MKNIRFFLVLLLLQNGIIFAQIGFGNSSPEISSVMDLSSTNKGFLTPRMTTLQRDAILIPAVGLLIYNTDEATFNTFDGTSWKDFTTSYKTITSASEISNNIATDIVADEMILSPKKGTYSINFNGIYKNALGTATATHSISGTTSELIPLYNLLMALPITATRSEVFGHDEIIYSGVYSMASISNSGNFTLDAQGNPDAIFVFRSAGTFGTIAAGVTLVGGAQACNIFWVSEGAISIGAGTTIYGTLLSHAGAVSVEAGTFIEGRMFTGMGAIVFGPGTAYMPQTVSNSINIGSLASFIMLSGGGALSNAGVSHFSGGIATAVGAITGFENTDGGILYAPTSTFQIVTPVDNNVDAIANFSIYQNGILIPASMTTVFSNSEYKNISIQAIATVNTGESIDVRWKKTSAKLVLGKRSLTIIKVN